MHVARVPEQRGGDKAAAACGVALAQLWQQWLNTAHPERKSLSEHCVSHWSLMLLRVSGLGTHRIGVYFCQHPPALADSVARPIGSLRDVAQERPRDIPEVGRLYKLRDT